MPCVICRSTATFKSTVFRGTSPTTVKLCRGCADKVRAEQQLARIKETVGHDEKMAAVDEFLNSVGL